MDVAMAYREKQGFSREDASNALVGFTLGQMRLCGLAAAREGLPDYRGISASQFEAGEAWARLCKRYEALSGIPSPNPKALDMMGGGGRSIAPDPDEDYVRHTRDQWRKCYNALAETARTVTNQRRPGARLMSLTYDVCVLNRPLNTLSEADCGDVRSGLNALARVLS